MPFPFIAIVFCKCYKKSPNKQGGSNPTGWRKDSYKIMPDGLLIKDNLIFLFYGMFKEIPVSISNGCQEI